MRRIGGEAAGILLAAVALALASAVMSTPGLVLLKKAFGVR